MWIERLSITAVRQGARPPHGSLCLSSLGSSGRPAGPRAHAGLGPGAAGHRVRVRPLAAPAARTSSLGLWTLGKQTSHCPGCPSGNQEGSLGEGRQLRSTMCPSLRRPPVAGSWGIGSHLGKQLAGMDLKNPNRTTLILLLSRHRKKKVKPMKGVRNSGKELGEL